MVFVAIIVVFSVAIAGLIFYYNGLLTEKDSQISSLNSQINALNSQIANLQQPFLVTKFSVGVKQNTNLVVNNVEMSGHVFFITGSITNQGKSTAYNVKLSVVANDIYGSKVIDMTVPLTGNFVVREDPSLMVGNNVIIEPIQTFSYVNVNIMCETVPVTWTITPICSSTP